MRHTSHPDRHTAPLAVSVVEAARTLGVSRSTIYELLTGELPSFTIGRRRLVRVSDIEAFLAQRIAVSWEAA